MNPKISPQELENAIIKELSEYSTDVTEGIKREIRTVTKEAVRTLKSTSPHDTGEYAQGWTSKVEYESAEDIRIRIYNRKKPQLTHLLENGHAKVDGGRVDGKPHIGPAEQQIEDKLQNSVKVVVRGGA